VVLDGGSPERVDPEEGGLGRVAVAGAGWQSLSYLGGKLLVLASTIVLARLLTPSDFGLVALALVFVTYAEVVADLGVAQALIYLPKKRASADAAVVVSAVWSIALVLVAVAAAPAVAAFFGRPDVTPIFRVLSVSLLLNGVGQVPDALLRRDLRFRTQIAGNLARALVQGVVSVTLAVAGAGPWSIVFGQLAGEAAWAAVLWALVDYRPVRGFHRVARDDLREVLRYGAPAAGNALVLSLVFNIDYLIVGRRLGARALGFYTLAFRIPQMLIVQVFYILSTVTFPLFARVRESAERLRGGYLLAVKLQSVYGVLAGMLLAVAAPDLVPLVFGAEWTPSVVPLRALALYAMFRSLGIGAVDLFKAVGRPALAFRLSLLRLAVVAPLLWFLAGRGIDEVAWGQAGAALALALLMQGVAARTLGLPAAAPARAVAPAVVAGTAGAAAAGAVLTVLPDDHLIRLLGSTAAGLAGALAALMATDRKLVPQIRDLLRRRTEPAPAR
jgi:lipopolysaccharide exporter